jgi:hypothetical protein
MPFFNSNNIVRNFFSAYTNISSASTFSPNVVCFNNGKVRWEYPDGSSQTTGQTYYNIPGSGQRLVKAVVNREKNIREIYFSNSSLVGNIKVFEDNDILYNQNAASVITINGNSQLSGLTLPSISNRLIKTINISSCNFSGQVDFSTINLSGYAGNSLYFSTYNNSKLNSILLQDVNYTNPVNTIEIDGCSIGSGEFSSTAPSGKLNFNKTIDLSKFSALGGELILTTGTYPHGNSGITNVYFPPSVSGNNFSRIHLNGLPNYTGNSYNLDLSWTKNKLAGYLIFNNLPLITGLTSFSSVTNYISQFDMGYCDLKETLDLSKFTKLNYLFAVNNNSGLTALNFNSNPGNSFSQFDISYTDIRSLDLSMYNNIGDYIINFTFCPNLTGVTFPNNLAGGSGCYLPYFYNSDFRDLDFSYMHLAHPFGTRLLCNDNPNLTGVTFPYEGVSNTGNTYNFMYFQNCNIKKFNIQNLSGRNDNILQVRLENNIMTSAVVNEILTKFDNTGWSGNSLNIGGTNAAPDTTSGGFNGIAAKNSLTGKSWTVLTS